MKKKEKIDFLNAIKTGHSGSIIACNPAHALDGNTMNAIIQNSVATIVPGKTGNCKETSLTKYCSRTIPEHISIEEIDEIKFIQNPS
ncbi:hypothetical protein ION14_004489 [Salmonella enterica]|uniref:hypothetical protein n=1 Tax=Enterobacteriaceae TaxID=543 RepID=UPI000D059188|nr:MULTISPECIES: hypothetical protein [Enterobacteriaceae]EGK1133413.1 hypothetical protein [Salmonella enterica]EHX1733941.1 hypothetical protein [Salmonella enterica]EKK2809132.1 hypothetical protein [Salmonella enterica]EKR9973423.1 hypothetical protein [Salmonella enterica]EKS0138113.1 hypothetical protein [Salmonella enterica]